MISAVPRPFAENVRGGAEHDVPGGRHTMYIGETPGARIEGLVEMGAAGHGNCAAMISVPTATSNVIPFCAGVTVSVPCTVLGAELGGEGCGDGVGEDGGDVGRPPVLLPGPAADGEEVDVPPPGTPVAELTPVAEGLDGPEGLGEPEAVPEPVP
ncbi:hypothetical protein ABH920_000792 [Catenulispora sp. EB89]|uniref:hypothetical protein n=1 Tax=Catenulispora sp. EB89 TaxID=3156257 RepID=UPI00351254F0